MVFSCGVRVQAGVCVELVSRARCRVRATMQQCDTRVIRRMKMNSERNDGATQFSESEAYDDNNCNLIKLILDRKMSLALRMSKTMTNSHVNLTNLQKQINSE
jgi:hypothetical protein